MARFLSILQEARPIRDLSVATLAGQSLVDNKKVAEIKWHLLGYFDISLHKKQADKNFEQIISDRLSGRIDFKEVRVNLDASVKSGGVGLEKRLANKLAKYLELLILSSK